MTTQTDFAESKPLHDPAEICTLPTNESAQRMAWIQTEILPHMIRSEPIADGIVVELAETPGLSGKLDRLVELERACCSGLEIVHTASAGQHRLEVHGADPQAPIFSLLRGEPAESPGFAKRIAKATGFGAATGLMVCCVLPIGLVALLGATVAAPFAALDQLWVIAAVSALSGVAAFHWQRRRVRSQRNQPTAEPSCGC